MSLLAFLAAIPQGYPLGGLLPTFWLGSRKTAIAGSGPPESPLSPLQLTRLLFLDPLYLMIGVGLAYGTVGHYSTRHLHTIHLIEVRCPNTHLIYKFFTPGSDLIIHLDAPFENCKKGKRSPRDPERDAASRCREILEAFRHFCGELSNLIYQRNILESE